MDVTGIIVSSSESLSLEGRTGLLFTLYNVNMDMYFNVLVHGCCVKTFWNVLTNCCYCFIHLKPGVLKGCSGLKKVLFKTTEFSYFQKINTEEIKSFLISYKIRTLMKSVGPLNSYSKSSNNYSSLISYQGFVTKVVSADLGIYQLDNKVLLYNIYYRNNCLNVLPGSELFVANGHALHNLKLKKNIILVCCGLSSVKILDVELLEDFHFHSSICQEYCLNIYDCLKLEILLKRINSKFKNLIYGGISFKTNPQVCRNLVEFFISDVHENVRGTSLMDEYFSNPHKCCAFDHDKLPSSCNVPYIVDVLEVAVNSISWIEVSKSWRFLIKRQQDSVLVGLLLRSPKGDFYIVDRSYKLQVIFSKQCSECRHDDSIIHFFDNANVYVMVALQEYDIILENIYCASEKSCRICYLSAPCCCFQFLGKFRKSKDILECTDFYFTRLPNITPNDVYNYDKNSLTNNSLLDTFSNDWPITISDNMQHFLVLSKLKTSSLSAKTCFKFLVLFIPHSPEILSRSPNTSISNDSDVFYETEDDAEFDSLIKDLSILSMENKQFGKVIVSSHKREMLLVGHTYYGTLKIVEEKYFAKKSTSVKRKEPTFEVISLMKTVHDDQSQDDYAFNCYNELSYSIKDVLLKKNTSENFAVSGVLINKFYVDSKNPKYDTKKIDLPASVCLELKDSVSKDTIRAYVTHSYENLIGLMSGTLLNLYGFETVLSQVGNIYLRSSFEFGIEINEDMVLLNSNSCTSTTASLNSFECERYLSNPLFQCSISRLCYIIKVVSVQIYSACIKCGRSFEVNCLCSSKYHTTIKMKAVIDDGVQQWIIHSFGGNAQKMLLLSNTEWKGIASCVEHNFSTLNYSDEQLLENFNYLPVINQVFCLYCANKSISRQVNMKYIKLPLFDMKGRNQIFALCLEVDELAHRDMMEFYCKLKDL